MALAACDGERYGEVVAVIAAPEQPTVTGDKSYMSTDDPNTSSCFRATSDYLTSFTDLSYQQTSDLLGIPLGTYKSRVRDAVHAVRDFLTHITRTAA